MWFKVNKLSLNTKKTHFMIFTNDIQRKKVVIADIDICIDGSNIENTKTSKFLGIYIDQSLTWDEHIKYTCNKLAKITGILIRARNKLYTSS